MLRKIIAGALLLGIFGLVARPTFPQMNDQGTVPCQKTNPNSNCVTNDPAATSPSDDDVAGVKVKLYYLRNADKVVELFAAINEFKDKLVVKNTTSDEIVLYGPKELRKRAQRIIVTLDLPRPGISMDMWGVQISSRDPDQLAKVMLEVRGIIAQTQQDIRKTFTVMQDEARKMEPEDKFREILEDKLRFTSALDRTRPLSFTDILMLMVASKNPGESAINMAEALQTFGKEFPRWKNEKEYKDYVKPLSERKEQPFERFLKTRGLTLNDKDKWQPNGNDVSVRAAQSQIALLQFALQYGNLVHNPEGFDSYYLQQAAENLNTRLQDAVNALNQDLQELFVVPTLIKIQTVVRKFKDVEYASVGKTSVASLSGIETEVKSASVSTFDVTPPLKLSELLTKAKTISDQVTPFDPVKNTVGALPLSQVVGLIGAFGEERSVWRELTAGVSLKVTPNVLRNMTSAELRLDLETGDPAAGTRESNEKPSNVPPLSRVSQHNVKTSVYVNALDFFDISSFGNESTHGGGRGYVPIIGPIWRGLFYDIPIFGKLFSWKRNPQVVHHESLVLTTSFIVPTAMGVAILYPTDSTPPDKFNTLKQEVDQRTRVIKENLSRLLGTASKDNK